MDQWHLFSDLKVSNSGIFFTVVVHYFTNLSQALIHLIP